jgi:hypothetical protein
MASWSRGCSRLADFPTVPAAALYRSRSAGQHAGSRTADAALALDQAASLLATTAMNADTYLRLLNQKADERLAHDPGGAYHIRHWASTPPVSRRSRQSATGPPGGYPDRTHTGKRRRADDTRSTAYTVNLLSLGARKGSVAADGSPDAVDAYPQRVSLTSPPPSLRHLADQAPSR